MADAAHGRVRMRAETRRGVAGGLLLATVYVVGYWFHYGLVSVAPGSPWGVGRFVPSTGLLSETIHLGFLVGPAFVASAAAVGRQRWSGSAGGRRADGRLLLGLALTPVLVGAVIGVAGAFFAYGRLLLSGDPGELVSFVLVLGLASFVVVVNGAVVLALVSVGAAMGYLVVDAVAVVLGYIVETS